MNGLGSQPKFKSKVSAIIEAIEEEDYEIDAQNRERNLTNEVHFIETNTTAAFPERNSVATSLAQSQRMAKSTGESFQMYREALGTQVASFIQEQKLLEPQPVVVETKMEFAAEKSQNEMIYNIAVMSGSKEDNAQFITSLMQVSLPKPFTCIFQK